jgi:thiosulfate/3-mercaptopyruvate sulfurtransferase
MTGIHPLIVADDLAATLDQFVVCDIRWDLTDREKGRATYEQGHIPGAVFVDLDADLSAPPGARGRHPLPDPADFAATLGSLGLSPERHVVVYDDVGGRVAARLWWMLRSIGHEGVQLLDGGYQAWLDAGHDIQFGPVTPEPTIYRGPVRFSGVIGAGELADKTVIDARAGARYRGEVEPVDPKPGHIPGAINIPTDVNLDETGRFRDARDLASVYADLSGDVVVSCGSGVNACHDALAMVVAGLSIPLVYVGSYSEWTRNDRPVNVGPEP